MKKKWTLDTKRPGIILPAFSLAISISVVGYFSMGGLSFLICIMNILLTLVRMRKHVCLGWGESVNFDSDHYNFPVLL